MKRKLQKPYGIVIRAGRREQATKYEMTDIPQWSTFPLVAETPLDEAKHFRPFKHTEEELGGSTF